ncbi:MAG: glutamate-1-semialdehyde 2,1-aminomutase [Actinomycetota bacterium]|nr:glutamate-1-semialdehyde 2,1-aminomutase [Actinomycetota bacterium]MCL6093915.1 glutamate-1-semialdehyde 2,1-aminomutase [Actinomycetota bacterium]MDA8167185.1 glutamate-1-semialdehyde 2,1-aminomutase [Actinomycetota bacterium]
METTKSQKLYQEALELLPGGVNSPVRAMRAVGRDPLFISRGEGSRMFDVDGNSYIDYVGSWGPLILGHSHPAVVESLEKTLRDGTSFGAPCALEVELAREVVAAVPSVEMVRMVSSGTEATMSALRVARGYTGREKIIKFMGCYHGAVDSLLVHAGSGVATLSLPDSPGVTRGTSADTLLAPYNDLEAVRAIMEREGEQVAAIILEPVAGNMGTVPPAAGFLEGLRQLATEFDTVLIFDEVMTGFRVAYGGAQERYGVTPDMSCLGKVIGGGMPVGAFGGRREIMETVAPAGSTYQAGTLSGNPLAMAAGLATLRELKQPGVYEALEEKSARLANGLETAARGSSGQLCLNRAGSMFTCFFTGGPVTDFESAKTSDTGRYAGFYRHMLEHGVYLAPSQFEAAFLSLAHSDADLEQTVAAATAFHQG